MVLRTSGLYETEPIGFVEQDWFLNQVAEVETTLPPTRLLLKVQEAENLLGRERSFRNGPRNIDIDILLYGDQIIRSPELELPHPRYRDRRFVLEPLAELRPDLRDPENGMAIGEMLERVKQQAVCER